MQQILQAELRTETGNGFCKQLRSEGKIPAVVYGRETTAINLTLEEKTVRNLLKKGAMNNVLLKLEIPDSKETRMVLIKDADIHPVNSSLLHVDLHQVSPEDRVQVKIPVELTGTSPGVIDDGGILDQPIRTLKVECKASEIPPQIEVDISSMEIGDAIQVKDLDVPADLEILTNPQRAVVSVQPPEEFDLEVTPTVGIEDIKETVEEAFEEVEELSGEEESESSPAEDE